MRRRNILLSLRHERRPVSLVAAVSADMSTTLPSRTAHTTVISF
jgi:hypothetical protein